MLRIRFALALLVLSCLAAVPAFAAEAGSPANAALGSVCSANRSTAPAAVPGTPEAPTWMLTILCGSCSDPGCAGQNTNTICYNTPTELGRCGAELTKCTDGHNYCICDIEPRPGF